ncbi:MAG: ECF-type sigma factor [Pirellulaceae bacterium]|nr:ECF-type sigma factor [Pirellulaceae bacterium]
MNDQDFSTFIERIRRGDSTAAEELLRQYEPLVRRQVRMKLSDTRMSRLYESVDYSQSVFASFFLRAVDGQFDLNEPQDLVRLLVTMTRNKIASSARKLLSDKRDGSRRDADSQVFLAAPNREDTPSQVASFRELLDQARHQMSEEELAMAELRREGLSWDDIAKRLGGTAQSRRMQFSRALERVTEALDLQTE